MKLQTRDVATCAAPVRRRCKHVTLLLTQRLCDENAGVERPLLVADLSRRFQRLLAALSRLLEALDLDVAVAEFVTEPGAFGCFDREWRLQLLLPPAYSPRVTRACMYTVISGRKQVCVM